MKRILLIFFLCCSSIAYTQNISLFVGTYTDDTSNGIYHYNFNSKTGEISNQQLAAKIINPSYLAYAANRKFLYAVSEVDNFNNSKSGSVTSFSLNNNGSLQFINKMSSNGAHPCHISLNKKGTKAVISNYTGGTISIHNIEKTGEINPAYQVINHNTSTKKSHTHSAQFFKNELFVSDLGLDYLAHYENSETTFLLKNNYLISDKAGPRHFEIAENGNFVYVINELNSTITVLKKGNEKYNEIQNISTLEKKFNGESFCADIHLSKNEKYLYASNRGENSIAVFKIDRKKGTVQKIQTISTKGTWPRNFCIAPNGKFLLVANQKSKNISVFTLNKKTGKLAYLYSKNTPTPVCLLF